MRMDVPRQSMVAAAGNTRYKLTDSSINRPMCMCVSACLLAPTARPRFANRDFFISGESYAVSVTWQAGHLLIALAVISAVSQELLGQHWASTGQVLL